MENVVPGILQRLRAADVFRMAGLAAASLGQEYSHSGAVHSTQRQGARLIGIVTVSGLNNRSSTSSDVGSDLPSSLDQFPAEVEVLSSTSWDYICACGVHTTTLCPHVAALLYQWLAQPTSFLSMPPTFPSANSEQQPPAREQPIPDAQSAPVEQAKPARTAPLSAKNAPVQRSAVPLGSLVEILGALSLSELRGIAREYELTTNGLSKQQLVETVHTVLQNPQIVRQIATTLEKTQRQLLAALTLAGGTVSDEDLRGLFERFSLGPANQLQAVLLGLQNKAFLFRTSLNSSSHQRVGLSGALFDVGWYVPGEVRTALHVSVPVTPLDVEAEFGDEPAPTLELAAPYALLADMLLVARTLDGYDTSKLENWLQLSQSTTSGARSQEYFSATRITGSLSSDGSCGLPPPADQPPTSLLAAIQELVPRSSAYLRFVVRLLRLADMVHIDDTATNRMRALPDLAAALLGPTHVNLAQDLFSLWLERSSYAELFELQEENLRVRCRATALRVPVMRPSDLDAENSEARQSVLALLAQTSVGQWMSFSSFAIFVYRLLPLFLQKRQRLFSSPHWWVELEGGRPLRSLQRNEWLRAEGYYLSRLLSGPLHWWGLCDLARSADGRLLAFRLTPLAASFFEKSLFPLESALDADCDEHTTLEVADAADLLVSCSYLRWPVIEVLELFTEPVGVRGGRLLYRLTPGALARALRRGHSPVRLLSLLSSLSAEDEKNTLLEGMIAQVERWCTSYGRIRVYTGVTLLETADTLVMRELAATTSLEDQVVRPIQPTLLVLKKDGAERIVEELRRRGQAPLLHDEDSYGTE